MPFFPPLIIPTPDVILREIGKVVSVGAPTPIGSLLDQLSGRKDDSMTRPSPKVEPPAALPYYANRNHQNESIISDGPSNIYNAERDVFIACRVVGGGALGGAVGQLYRDASGALQDVMTLGLGGLVDRAPDPTYHWCVVVGQYLHQLQATSLPSGWNYYTNEVFHKESGGWKVFKWGVTQFNDVAMRNAAVQTIIEMPEAYDLIDNNCQHFTLRLLDKVLRDGRKKAKVLDGTYRITPAPKLVMKMDTVVTRVDAAVESEDHEAADEQKQPMEQAQPIILTPMKVVAPKLADLQEAEEDRTEVVPTDPQAHFDSLQAAVDLMIKETPTIKESAILPGSNQ